MASGDAAVLDRHNSAIEAWGDGLARQIGRICRSAAAIGVASGARCESPP